MKKLFSLLCLVFLCWIQNAQAKENLTIAAAADLKFALDAFSRHFQKEHPAFLVRVTYGSSGNLFAQADNGAPFDLFLSADAKYPRQLIERNKADDKSFFLYGIGHLVLWAPKSSNIQVKNGFAALVQPQVRRIAIANPQHAPYGRAAEAALKKAGIYEKIKNKLVRGENVAQTAQFVQAGAADTGLIALSLALAPAMKAQGKLWNVPTKMYPRLEQGGVILEKAPNPAGARLFRQELMSQKGRAILKQVGFSFN